MMKVERLKLRNFRNIEDCTFYPDPSVNFLIGSNGQGKTSVIEALGFLATLRSFKDSKLAHLVRWGQLSSEISCTLSETSEKAYNWDTEFKIHFQALNHHRTKMTKLAFINGKAYRSSTQFLSQRFGSHQLGFHSIIFNPSDHDLVRGDPSQRRAYLNRVIAAEDIEYLKIFQKYQRVLDQRNALLKSVHLLKSDILRGFTEQLCHYGIALTQKRLQWVQKLGNFLNGTLQKIAPDQPELKMSYLSKWIFQEENLSHKNKDLDAIHFTGQGQLPSLELLEQSFWAKASVLETAERRAGCSLVGPHRDDWAFFLGNQVLKGHGSQGEVRSALLALKLSEIELFRNRTGHRPVFLLDDFSSELDRGRRVFLLQFLVETDLQTFVTTTEDSSYFGKRYWVSKGMIEKGSYDSRTKTI